MYCSKKKKGKKLNMKHKISKDFPFHSTEKPNSAENMVGKRVDLNSMSTDNCENDRLDKETICRNSNFSSDVSDTFENTRDYQYEIDADVSSSGGDDEEYRFLINPDISDFTGDILYIDHSSNPNFTCTAKCFDHMEVLSTDELISCVKNCQKLAKETSDKKLNIYSLSENHSQALFQQYLTSDHEDSLSQNISCSPFFYGEQADVSETIKVFLGKNAYHNPRLEVLLRFDDQSQVYNVFNMKKVIKAESNNSSLESRKKYVSSKILKNDEENCEKTWLNIEKCFDNKINDFEGSSLQVLNASEINHIALEHVEKEVVSNTGMEIISENSKKYLNANSKTDSSSNFLISKNQDLNEEADKSLQLNDIDHLSDRNNHDNLGDLNEEEIDETLSIIAPSPEHLFDSSESDDDKDLSFKRYSRKEILPPVSTSDHGTIISKSKLNDQYDYTTCSLQVVNESLAVSINNDTAVESALVNNVQKENHKNCDFDIAGRLNFCRSFLQKGHCSRPMCRYRHSYPTFEEICSKEKAVKFLSKLKEHCDDGILGKAFEEAHSQLPNHPLPVKCKALIMLLHTSVKLNNISLIKDAFSLAKQFEVYNSDLCSSFIISCKNHSNLVSDSILELFGFCEIKKIKLSEEALSILLNMFHHDWRHLIAMMKFMCCVNKTYVPQQLLNQCLLSMQNEPQLISQMKDLLIELPNEQFSQIELIAIEDFICLLEKYNHASEALKCRTRISHNNQIFTANLPSTNPFENKTVHLIKHYINNERWGRLMEIFNEYGIVKKDGMVIQVIHSCFCSQMDNLGERFRSFIRAITGNGKRELSVSYRFLLGQMGTALMLEAHSSKEFKAAFEILEILHWYNINYYELQNLALPQLQTSRSSTICIPPWIVVTPSRVALVATDVCIELNKPEEALQVLKDCHWAVPSDKLVDEVRKNELIWRAQLLMKLSLLLHHKKLYLEGANVLKMLLESLQQDLNDAVIRDSMTTDLDEIYNRSLEELLNAKNIEMALSLYKYFKFLGSVLYVRPTIWRAFIVSCIANGLKNQAEQIFDRCILMGTYKINMPISSSYPTCLKLPTYLTKEEIFLILPHFLEKMFTLLPSNQQKADFEEIFSLSIILEETKFEDSDHRLCSIPNTPATIEKTRKIVLHILQEIMNPPFDISPNSKSDTIYIEPMSLYQHFIFWKKFHPDNYKNDDTATIISNGNNMAVIPNSLRKTEAFRTSIASSQYTGFGLECSSTSGDVSNESASILPFISNNKSFQTSLFSNDGKPSTNSNHSRISAKGLFGGSLEPCERQFHNSESKNSQISFFNGNNLIDGNLIADSNVELSLSVFPSGKQSYNTKLNSAIKRHKPNILWNKKIYQRNISQLKKKKQKKRKLQTNISHNKNKYQANISQNKSKVEANEISEMSGSFSDFKNIKMCISVDSHSIRTVTNSKSKDSEKQSSEDCSIKNYPLSPHSEPFILQTECEKFDRIRSEIPEMEILSSLSPTDIDKVCTTSKEDNSFKSNDSGHVISNNLAAATQQKSEKQQNISESPKSYPITTVVSKTNYSRLNAYDGLDFQPQSIPIRQNSVVRKPARFLHPQSIPVRQNSIARKPARFLNPQSLISSRPPRYHSNTNVFYHRRPHIQESKNSYLSGDLSNKNDNHLQKQGFQESEAVNKIQHFLKCQVLCKHNSLKSTECEARVSYLTNRFLSQCGDLIDTLDKRTMKKLTEFAAANV